MSENLIGLMIGIVFLIVGMLFLTFTVLNIYFNEKVENWNILNGEILTSKLTKKVNEYSMDLDIYSNSTEVNYNQIVKFKYQFENHSFHSNKIFYLEFNNWFYSNKMKKKIAETYANNKTVRIFLNPKESQKAFLIQKAPIDKLIIYTILSLISSVYFLFY